MITQAWHLRSGRTWDSCRWSWLICWYRSRVPTRCWKSACKQISLWNSSCQISTCWESGYRKHKQGWFCKLISVAAHTISRWEIYIFLPLGSHRSAMQIFHNQSLQVLIPESLNSMLVGRFASLKPLLPICSCWTPQLTGNCAMILTSLIWNEIVLFTAKIILHHHHCVRRPIRIWHMRKKPFFSIRALLSKPYDIR